MPNKAILGGWRNKYESQSGPNDSPRPSLLDEASHFNQLVPVLTMTKFLVVTQLDNPGW